MQPQNPNNYWQPGDQPASTPPHPIGPAQAPQPVVQAPVAPSPPVAPQQPQPIQQPAPVPQAQPQLQPQSPAPIDPQAENVQELPEQEEDESTVVNWQAKEYIHQEKNGMWFFLFAIVLLVLLASAILLMKSWSFAILLVVIAVVIVVFAKRPPRVMSYSLTNKGLHIGDTLHAFKDFKAFGVVHDGDEYSVMLIPTKRFLPGVTVYFPEESGEDIVDMLGARLPMQDLHLDWLDRFVRKLRL